MFGSVKYGASAYSKVGIETGVASASPHKLIVMLFEGAMSAISSAVSTMKSGDIAAKGQSVSKAITIIDEGLRASLNKEAGGDIARNLDSLYEYMSRRLLEANMTNSPEMLEEVHGLLSEIKSAWDEIGDSGKTNVVPMQAARPLAHDSLEPRLSSMVRA